MEERALPGGIASAGAVVRVGDSVYRPGGPNAAVVRDFLSHLASAGFTAAPRVLGTAPDGREVLSFEPGAVAVPPFPDWAAGEELLVSVAELQRSLHEAAAGWAPVGVLDGRELPPEGRGGLMCHLDLCLENTVVRDGRAAAFIDFDLARPAERLYDIAIAVRHWIPLRDPADIADARAGLDQAARFRAFTDVHGLGEAGRGRVLELLAVFLADALDSVGEAARAGHPGFAEMWAGGYEAMNARSREWLRRAGARLIGA
ncbi:phosphotransferase [Phytomonospora endophytica]|uniref:Aminoglycoside phosphotransferase domain-containing protein n=1 Tax=Phytomonospora endophytica TaxID=714109 RepID=A0A841FW82_9ACTN|nr:phosphotransferase [Phytomonospora endophytica]MBB6039013.1 hypothetical protein [Phytomonospora endophytica]GIG69491.1 hypothetical protein Pen01_57860 [Phytomonospora endophytica]